MHYHLKSKPKIGNYFKIILTVVLFLLLCGILFLFSGGARTAADAAARPLWLGFDFVTKPLAEVKEFFTRQGTLAAENVALQNEVSSLTLKDIDYDTVVKENNDLKNQIGTENLGGRITSRILSKPPQSPYDTLVIDVGSDDGVTLGNTGYLSDNIIVGFVSAVTPHTSLITLFSSSGQSQQATDSRTGASFELSGQGGANFSVQVPKDTDILWGDTFLYPSDTASIIGNVYFIDTDSQSSFKTVYVRIPVNVFSSQWVFVAK